MARRFTPDLPPPPNLPPAELSFRDSLTMTPRLTGSAPYINKRRSSSMIDEEPMDPHRGGSMWSITHMPMEVAEVAIDFPAELDLENIQRHSVLIGKDPFQKAVMAFSFQEDAEKIFAASELPELIEQNCERAFDQVVPLLAKELKESNDEDLHTVASKSVQKVVMSLFPKKTHFGRLLITLPALNVCKMDNEISDIWCVCFLKIIENMSPEQAKREILPHITERLGKKNASTNCKKAAAKLIGALTVKLPPDLNHRRLFHIVVDLCCDENPLVRVAMTQNIPEFIANLGEEKENMLPVIAELASDQETEVVAKLIRALGKTVSLMEPNAKSSEKFFQLAIKLYRKLINLKDVHLNVDYLVEFSRYLGKVLGIFSDVDILNEEEKEWFLNAYLQLSRIGFPEFWRWNEHLENHGLKEYNRYKSALKSLPHSWPGITGARGSLGHAVPKIVRDSIRWSKWSQNIWETESTSQATLTNSVESRLIHDEKDWICRANIAAGFADFMKFAKPLVDFHKGLHSAIAHLNHDPDPEVRAKMAANLYPIIKLLGPNDGGSIYAEVVDALSDNEIPVLEAVIPNLQETLKILMDANIISSENMTKHTVEISGAILFCEMHLNESNNWRLHAKLLDQFAKFLSYFPSDHVYDHFVPALFQRLLHMRQLPCRTAAADAIVVYLRNCKKKFQRDDIRKRIEKGFAQGSNVYDRMLFIQMTKKILEVFSRKFYRENFFETTLQMAADDIPNIRMKAVKMMPALKNVLRMGDDKKELKKLEETIAKMKKQEKDSDVVNAVEDVIPEVAKVDAVLKRRHNGEKTQEDLDDEAKEREEEKIATMELGAKKPEEKAKLAPALSNISHLFPSISRIPGIDPPLPAPPQHKPPPPSQRLSTKKGKDSNSSPNVAFQLKIRSHPQNPIKRDASMGSDMSAKSSASSIIVAPKHQKDSIGIPAKSLLGVKPHKEANN